jgi:hypothetical protein
VQQQINSLMAGEAYRSAKHPNHAAAVQEVFQLRRQMKGDVPVTN